MQAYFNVLIELSISSGCSRFGIGGGGGGGDDIVGRPISPWSKSHELLKQIKIWICFDFNNLWGTKLTLTRLVPWCLFPVLKFLNLQLQLFINTFTLVFLIIKYAYTS